MKFFVTCLAAVVAAFVSVAAGEKPLDLSDLPAVTAALKAHYVDPTVLSDRELNEAAVRGILDHLGQGAKIISTNAPSASAPDIAKTEVIGTKINYIRLGKLGPATGKALDAALAAVPCDKGSGFILDLRFVRGEDFRDAADVAGRFLVSGAPLFLLKNGDKERGRFNTSFGKPCVTAPLMVLINSETAGSAEALAAALRDQQRAVLLGSVTAGEAVERVELPLAGGQKLALAVAEVVLPDGARIFPSGMMPDVAVKTDLELQRKLLLGSDAQKNLRATLEPRITKRRMNEAELVRTLGPDDDKKPAAAPAKPAADEDKETRNENVKVEQPADVVLSRALDILKGIRALRRD